VVVVAVLQVQHQELILQSLVKPQLVAVKVLGLVMMVIQADLTAVLAAAGALIRVILQLEV